MTTNAAAKEPETRQTPRKAVIATRRVAMMHERREQILDAATRLLVNTPDQFSMRNLAAEASVSIRTIYNLIGDQAKILIAVTNRLAEALQQQIRREQVGRAFDGMLREIELIREMDFRNDSGLAAIRALRLLGPSNVTQQVSTVVETDYLPDLRLAIEQKDLTNDVPAVMLAATLATFTSQAVTTWAIDGNSLDYRDRVIRGLLTTLLVSATPPNRKRCLALLEAQKAKDSIFV